MALAVGAGDGSKPAVEIPRARGATALALGNQVACAIVEPQKLVCWSTDPARAADSAVEEPLADVTAVTPTGGAGSGGSVGISAISSGGQVWSLSAPDGAPARVVLIPRGGTAGQIDIIADAVAITGSENGGCAKRATGKISCRGTGIWQLPDGSPDPALDGLANARQIVAGGSSPGALCALDDAGALRCLGNDGGNFNSCVFNKDLCKTPTPWGACSAPDCGGPAGNAGVYPWALPAPVVRVVASLQGAFVAELAPTQALPRRRFLPLWSQSPLQPTLVESCDERPAEPYGHAADAYDLGLDTSTMDDVCAILAVGPGGADEVRCSLAYRANGDTRRCAAVKIELPL